MDSNIFTRNTADGQHLSGVVAFVNGTNAVITNNIFVDNPTRAINLTLPSGSHSIIANNTFVRNNVGVKFASFSTADIRNNIFYDNGTALVIDYPYQLPTFDHNLLFENATDFSGTDALNLPYQIVADPLFAGPGDFRLLRNSPARNGGTSTGAPNHDFLGNLRPLNGGYDVGAFEYVPEPSASAAMFCLVAQ